MVLLKRGIVVVGVLAALLAAAAVYLGYAPRPELPAGPLETSRLEVGGYVRTYSVFRPKELRAGAPVLFALHPSQSSGADMRGTVGSALERIAEEEGLVVVYPDGYEGHFNDCRRVASYSARTLHVDDVGFMRRILDELVADAQVDPKRVFALGYSNGGQMALRLALETPQLVRGAAAIAANLPAPDNMDCTLAPVPARYIVLVEGTQDPLNPYEGGPVSLFGFGNRGNVLSAQASAEWFARVLELAPAGSGSVEQIAGFPVRQQDWVSPSGHVRLVTIEGGGHTVPQAAYRSQRILGATLRSDAVLESIWRLFSEASG